MLSVNVVVAVNQSFWSLRKIGYYNNYRNCYNCWNKKTFITGVRWVILLSTGVAVSSPKYEIK